MLAPYGKRAEPAHARAISGRSRLRGRAIAVVSAVLLCHFLSAPFVRAQSVPFYEDRGIVSVVEPIVVGEESFVGRVEALAGDRRPFGLVLSGGSARAFAHIGVLEVLEETGIAPDYIVGDSMGAIIALLYCAGLAPADIVGLFDAYSVNELFDLQFPLSGGFLDSGRVVALLRALVGDLDISELPIPTIVVCEDIVSRRQVLLAEGDFAAVATASIAQPVISEPVRFGDMILIDGGAIHLVPAEAAYRYSDAVAVATSFYDRKLNFSSPFVVLNRSMDIGKTRRSVEDMLARKPVVIRCPVESFSYMEYSRADKVADCGRASARAALGEIREIAPTEHAPSAALVERRAYYHERVARLVAARRLGACFTPPTDYLVGADLRLFDEAEGCPDVFSGRRWIGPEAEFRAGPASVSLSALAGLEGHDDRAWGLGFGGSLKGYFFPSREGRESGLALYAGLHGVISGSGVLEDSHSRPEPRELAAAARGGAAFELCRGLIVRPEIGAELDRPIPDGETFRRASGGLGLEAQPGSRLRLGMGGELDVDSDENLVPGASAFFDWAFLSQCALRLNGRYRSVLKGPGIEAPASDPYRSAPLDGRASRRFLGRTELVWLARPLEAALGEIAILGHPELGLYADFSGAEPAEAAGDEALETRVTIGASARAGLSFMGLSPISLSAFVGLATDDSGWVFGIRALKSLF
jgi:NTE family protein